MKTLLMAVEARGDRGWEDSQGDGGQIIAANEGLNFFLNSQVYLLFYIFIKCLNLRLAFENYITIGFNLLSFIFIYFQYLNWGLSVCF